MIPEELALRLAMTRSDLEAQAVAEDREHDETGRVAADVDPPHNAKAQRRDGPIPHYWHRWFASCRCGWWQDGRSREDAYKLAEDHNELNPEPPTDTYECTCYEPVSMEYGPNFPCARCKDRNMA